MRRNWSANRLLFLTICLFVTAIIMVLSALGIIRPLEGLVSTPINFVSRMVTQATLRADETFVSLSDVEALRERNAVLEEALARQQAELIELREIASDYERIADLLSYTRANDDAEYVMADVIAQGQIGLVRSIVINKGTRNGIRVGLPVVTEAGLVGRVFQVTANSSQVQLVTDQNSFVNARIERTRAQGSVQGEGLSTGSLRMLHIPPESDAQTGDLVFTSGLGGNFPADIFIGTVESVRNLEFELSQEAQLSTQIDFQTLEFVLVITSFEPADLSIFEATEEE